MLFTKTNLLITKKKKNRNNKLKYKGYNKAIIYKDKNYIKKNKKKTKDLGEINKQKVIIFRLI
jgi:hypothetical protein